MKLCSKCQISKDETEFHGCSKSPDGRYYQCKVCANAIQTQSRRAKGIPARARKEYEDTETHKWCRACEQLKSITHYAWRQDRQSFHSFCRECRARLVREKRQANRDETNRKVREWRAANPEKYLISKSKRRATETAAYDVTEKDLRGILRRQYQQCAICSACMGARMTLDHIVPLSRGGQHRVGNLQYLCSTCNFRKSDRWLAVARRSIVSVDPDTGEVVP